MVHAAVTGRKRGQSSLQGKCGGLTKWRNGALLNRRVGMIFKQETKLISILKNLNPPYSAGK